MFHKEFYPTPLDVLLSLNLDCKGKVCAEPHGGKGDAIEFMFSQGAKKVRFSEITSDLETI